MLSGARVVLAAAVVLLVASLSATPVAADDWASETWTGQLLTPLVETDGFEDCHVWSNCQELRGIALEDINVTEVMEEAVENNLSDRYGLNDPSLPGFLTVWRLCKYDANHTLIECDGNIVDPWKQGGDMPAETRHVRLIVDQGALPEYRLTVSG